MAQYPPDWQIFPQSEYATFHRNPAEATDAGMHLLVPVTPGGRATGQSRIHIFGSSPFSVHFPLARIMHNLPPYLANAQAELIATLEEVTPPANLTATAWEDAEDKYKKRTLLITMPDGEAFPEARFFQYLQSPSSDKSCIGASLRWAVAGSSTAAAVQMELQSLPTQARYLTKPNLKSDNSVSVLVMAFGLNADLFDGNSHAGPVPLLFSTDVTATAAALSAGPYIIHEDLADINNRILMMEHLSMGEAVAYLQKGKARKATGTGAFLTAGGSSSGASCVPPPKKSRYNQFPAMNTGKPFQYIS
jgi:hypothetical protein